MSSWHSYPKIYNVGHAAVAEILKHGPVVIEEKIDGSQFSFGRFGSEVRVRSKGQEMHVEAPEKMFQPAVDYVKAIADQLHDGWTYRGEFLGKPKHNTLAYDRTPKNFIILFDVNTAQEQYLSPSEKQAEAERIGLECVPTRLVEDPLSLSMESVLEEHMAKPSYLGGQSPEGVVFKNYALFGPDKKALMAKHVSEQFKEVHKGEWRTANPTNGDVVGALAEKYRTPARWHKAEQHLRERGKLEVSPRDIPALMAETVADVEAECALEIKEALFAFAWPRIRRNIVRGLPEWWKGELLKKQFAEPE